jgi:hypothetical protein
MYYLRIRIVWLGKIHKNILSWQVAYGESWTVECDAKFANHSTTKIDGLANCNSIWDPDGCLKTELGDGLFPKSMFCFLVHLLMHYCL